MIVNVDTREKPQAIETIKKQFQELDVSYERNKLNVGDYSLVGDSKFVIDRKQTIDELYQNVCSGDHARLKREILRAKEQGIHICFLIEDDRCSCVHDFNNWVSKYTKSRTAGKRLYKAVMTMIRRYDNISFQFCRRDVTGYRINELLRENDHEQQQEVPGVHKTI